MTNPAEPEKPLGADAAEAWVAETRNRFRQARLWAAHAAPYLTSALFALQPVILEPNISEPQPDTQADRTGGVRQPVPDPEFRAFPADTHWRIHIDPGTALVTPTPEFGWWLLHHIGHLCRHHAARSPVAHDHDADQSRHAVGEQTDDLAPPAGGIKPPTRKSTTTWRPWASPRRRASYPRRPWGCPRADSRKNIYPSSRSWMRRTWLAAAISRISLTVVRPPTGLPMAAWIRAAPTMGPTPCPMWRGTC